MAQIKVGDSLPDTSFTTMTDQGPMPRTTKEAFGGKTVALFAVPGAFTPTCHRNHLPSFLKNADALRAKGVDEIACVSVNDVFVLSAWSKDTGAAPEIQMLADGGAAFTKAVGMDLDLTERGLGIRSKRYVMLVEDGKVTKLMVEDNPGEAVASNGDALLEAL